MRKPKYLLIILFYFISISTVIAQIDPDTAEKVSIDRFSMQAAPDQRSRQRGRQVYQLKFGILFEALRYMSRGDVSDFMGHHGGQFVDLVHDVDEAREDENLPPGTGKGVQIAALNDVEMKSEWLRFKRTHQVLSQIIDVGVGKIILNQMKDTGYLEEKLPAHLCLFFYRKRQGVGFTCCPEKNPYHHKGQAQSNAFVLCFHPSQSLPPRSRNPPGRRTL